MLKRRIVVSGPINKFPIAVSESLDEKLMITKEMANAIRIARAKRTTAKQALNLSTFDFLLFFIITSPSLLLHSGSSRQAYNIPVLPL